MGASEELRKGRGGSDSRIDGDSGRSSRPSPPPPAPPSPNPVAKKASSSDGIEGALVERWSSSDSAGRRDQGSSPGARALTFSHCSGVPWRRLAGPVVRSGLARGAAKNKAEDRHLVKAEVGVRDMMGERDGASGGSGEDSLVWPGSGASAPSPPDATLSAHGVFDGHGGSRVATYASGHVLQELFEELDRATALSSPASPDAGLPPPSGPGDDRAWALQDRLLEALPASLVRAFERVDAEASRLFRDGGGSTATLAVQVGWQVVVAAVGDSLAFVDYGGDLVPAGRPVRGSEGAPEGDAGPGPEPRPIPGDGPSEGEAPPAEDPRGGSAGAPGASADDSGRRALLAASGIHGASANHRLSDNEAECARIVAAGGEVAPSTLGGEPVGPPRVWPGGLAMGRSLGDCCAEGLSPGTPELRAFAIPPRGGARLIIASDGLWDAATATQAARHVRDVGATEAAHRLLALAIKRAKLKDDVTVVVVDFLPSPSCDLPPGLRRPETASAGSAAARRRKEEKRARKAAAEAAAREGREAAGGDDDAGTTPAKPASPAAADTPPVSPRLPSSLPPSPVWDPMAEPELSRLVRDAARDAARDLVERHAPGQAEEGAASEAVEPTGSSGDARGETPGAVWAVGSPPSTASAAVAPPAKPSDADGMAGAPEEGGQAAEGAAAGPVSPAPPASTEEGSLTPNLYEELRNLSISPDDLGPTQEDEAEWETAPRRRSGRPERGRGGGVEGRGRGGRGGRGDSSGRAPRGRGEGGRGGGGRGDGSRARGRGGGRGRGLGGDGGSDAPAASPEPAGDRPAERVLVVPARAAPGGAAPGRGDAGRGRGRSSRGRSDGPGGGRGGRAGRNTSAPRTQAEATRVAGAALRPDPGPGQGRGRATGAGGARPAAAQGPPPPPAAVAT